MAACPSPLCQRLAAATTCPPGICSLPSSAWPAWNIRTCDSARCRESLARPTIHRPDRPPAARPRLRARPSQSRLRPSGPQPRQALTPCARLSFPKRAVLVQRWNAVGFAVGCWTLKFVSFLVDDRVGWFVSRYEAPLGDDNLHRCVLRRAI